MSSLRVKSSSWVSCWLLNFSFDTHRPSVTATIHRRHSLWRRSFLSPARSRTRNKRRAIQKCYDKLYSVVITITTISSKPVLSLFFINIIIIAEWSFSIRIPLWTLSSVPHHNDDNSVTGPDQNRRDTCPRVTEYQIGRVWPIHPRVNYRSTDYNTRQCLLYVPTWRP